MKRLADASPDSPVLPLATSINLTEGIDLDEALTRQWDTDAHFVTYVADDGAGNEMYARINKGAFVHQLEQAGGRVVVRALVFDHDLPRTSHGEKQEWSAESQEEFLGSLSETLGNSNLDPTAWYSTAHGSRFVYELTEPVAPLDAEAMMLGIMAEFKKRGIELDDACKDWTRMFRLPNVEREDYGRYESTVLTGGPKLDPADAPRGEVVKTTLTSEVYDYEGEMPSPEEVADLLNPKGDNGRRVKSELLKRAKIMLQGRVPSEGIVFEEKPLVEGEENWNQQVQKVVGQVVGQMGAEASSTPEGIYALLHSAIEQLQDREMRGAKETDWFDTTWSMICRTWAKEDAQLRAQREELEQRQAEASIQREEMIEKLREARPEDVPTDSLEAEEWFTRRMIASNGQQHYVMRPDQSYNIMPVAENTLISMIRDLGMEDIIPVTEIVGKAVKNRSSRDLIADHAIPIVDIEANVRADVAYIDGAPGHRKLNVPVHKLNQNLRPVFDKRVDEWLTALGGPMSDRLKEWLAHSLDVKRAICAINLYGAPGTGKGMLAQGLAECFQSMRPNDHKALGQWNGGLLENPVVNCDEGVPAISSAESLSLDQAFRSLVTGGNITIRKMRTDPFSAKIYPRIMFTSNDRDIIRSIVGKRDLTEEDTQAIETRLLSIEVSDRAKALLTSHGNYDYTRGWVEGERASELTVANHIYYLYQNRERSQQSSGRLLVEGDVNTKLVKNMRMTTRGAENVLIALVKLIQGASSGQGQNKVIFQDTDAYTSSAAIKEFIDSNMVVQGGVTIREAGTALRNFSHEDACDADGKPRRMNVDGRRGRYYLLDLGTIYEHALANGIEADQVRRLLCEQPGGPERAEAIEASV